MSEKKSSAKDDGGFKKFLWNTETGEFLGRTGSSWFKITVFYIIFFTGLAAFFSLMLWIFMQTLNPNEPKWTQDNGLIGTNPGVGFRPMPDQDKNVESTLIWYKRGSGNSSAYWIDQLKKELSKYEKAGGSGDQGMSCNDNNESAGPGKWCQMQISAINRACSAANDFGYPLGEPCILIKLNRIFGWKPDAYKAARADEFASDMPLDLQDKIKKSPQDHIWFTCEGENPADRENLGTVQYFPQQGIPTNFFPYLKQEGYQSPFIFVKLDNPVSNVLINVECKAWAKNIHPSRLDRVGTVHFEIMID